MKASEIMVQPVTVRPEVPVKEVLEVMFNNHLRELLITYRDQIYGITSYSWLLERGIRENVPISQFMFEPSRIYPETNHRDVIRKMASTGLETLPVVDEDGLLVGAVTSESLLSKLRLTGTVSQAMQSEPIYVNIDDTITKARQLLTSNEINKLPVVDDQKMVVGILTTRDIIRRVFAGKIMHFEPLKESDVYERATVRNVMTPDPVTTTPKEDINAAIGKLLSGQFRSLPVAIDGKLVGILCMKDILEFAANHAIL